METLKIFPWILAATLLVAPARAENPYLEGVKRAEIPAELLPVLKHFAENSRNLLKEALRDAQGLSFAEANDIYFRAMLRVVQASHEQKLEHEILLRYALTQALELTYGIPTSDGQALLRPRTLRFNINTDLSTVILEDSLRLALHYAPNDIAAIEKGTLKELPYMKFAYHRLERAQQWLSGIFDPVTEYGFLEAVLRHWFNAAALEQMNLPKYAEEIMRVKALLEQLARDGKPADGVELQRKVRMLRGELRRLLENVRVKVQGSYDSGKLDSRPGPALGSDDSLLEGNHEAMRFCAENMKYSDYRLACMQLVRGRRFLGHALDVCRVMRHDDYRVACLKTIADQTGYQREATMFCAGQMKYDDYRVSCLATILNHSYDNETLALCRTMRYDDYRVSCLKSR